MFSREAGLRELAERHTGDRGIDDAAVSSRVNGVDLDRGHWRNNVHILFSPASQSDSCT